MVQNYKGTFIMGAIMLFIFIAYSMRDKSKEINNTPANGDLDSTFKEKNKEIVLTPEEELEKNKTILIADGWKEKDIKNGQFSPCYNFQPKNGPVDNFLEVQVGSGTDVAIKVMNLKTNKCIRYVFINSKSIYKIKDIPEGKYYLKIAYGKNWFSKVDNKQCIGKFIRNQMYEKGEDIMDFNLKYSDGGYNIPSYKLSLDVVSTGSSNSFNSQNISEDEFNQ